MTSKRIMCWTAFSAAVGSMLVAPSPSTGQEYPDLAGQIVDAETDEPVGAAAVQVVGRVGTYETDDDGTFLVSTVRVDQLTLLVQRIGYYPLRVHLRLDPGGSPTVTLDDPLPLRPLPIELRELIVELQDPWLDRPFQSKGFYRRDRLFNRREMERTPYEMQTMLARLAGAGPAGCGFDFYVDGRWVHPASVKGVVMNRAPLEFEAAEVYYSNARMGQRENPARRFRPDGSGADSPTGGRDLTGMPCGVFRLWSLGERQLGERQHVGPMDPGAMGPLAEDEGEVRGQIVGPGGRPVPGILLTIVDQAGAPAGAAISDTTGRYILRVPAPGSYTLVAVRPGLPDWQSETFPIARGQVVDITPRTP